MLYKNLNYNKPSFIFNVSTIDFHIIKYFHLKEILYYWKLDEISTAEYFSEFS